MKIGWCTPVNDGSGITRFSRYVATELVRRGHDLTILASDAVPLIPASNPIRMEPIKADRAHAYDTAFDVLFYNFGDHFGFHARLLDIVDAVPGIGIFHDASILNFFLGWADHVGLSPAARERLVLDHCGPAALERFEHRGGKRDWFGLCADVPMIEWLARRTGAAIVHAGHYEARVAAACPGPTARANLAYRPSILPDPSLKPGGEAGALVVTTIGRVNPNKCYAEVIGAIGASALLRPRAIYRIFGECEPGIRENLEALAAVNGVRVEFAERRDDAALTRCLESSDIICALRRPILEGASASAIEGLMSARPVVVADAGFYAELPDDYVVKVPPNVPVPALTAVLERLASDGQGRHARGLAARAWALEAFSAERYCDAVERLLADFIEAKPLLRLGARIGRNLARLGFAPHDPAVAAIAAAAHGLFVGSPIKGADPPALSPIGSSPSGLMDRR